MIFGYVPPPFGDLWEDIALLLDNAVKKGGNDWGEVRETLEDGRSQLWLTVEDNREVIAAMVTRMDGDTFEIWLAGGDIIPGSIPFLETALKAAKEEGATNARIIGRKGWTRVLRPYGWKTRDDELVKDLA